MDRIDKINHQIQKEISIIIQKELGDPRLEFVTITKADVSRDLKFAKISYSALGSKERVQEVGKILEKAKGLIRKYVGEAIKMRYTPQLMFIYDRSLEYSARVEAMLQEIHDEHDKDSGSLKK
jgi:ribosome-binding factor A